MPISQLDIKIANNYLIQIQNRIYKASHKIIDNELEKQKELLNKLKLKIKQKNN